MKIKRLEIENFRGFEGKVSIDFPEDLAVIIGVNGSGKSSILKALAYLLNSYLASNFAVSNQIEHIDNEDININKTETVLMVKVKTETGFIEDSEMSWGFRKSFKDAEVLGGRDFKVLGNQYREELRRNRSLNIPIVTYYQSSRNLEVGSNNGGKHNFLAPQSEANFQAFNKNITFGSFVKWFIEQVNIENQLKVESRNFEAFNPKLKAIKDALEKFLGSFPGAKFKNLRVGESRFSANTNQKQTFLIDKNGQELELRQLSDGEKVSLLLVFDIAYRLSIANPGTLYPLHGKGVILIDEIGLHLHPLWQKAIINCLQTTFPNIQFIVTTHSPLILNQVKSENIFVLENNQCIPLSNKFSEFKSYGAEIEEILKLVQGTDDVYPQEVSEELDRYFKLIDNNQIEEAKALQKELKQLIDSQHPELLKGQTLIELKELED